MIVIADSSPLIALARIGKLKLLPDVFGKVVIPEAVHREVVLAAKSKPGVREVSTATWISVQHVDGIDEFVFSEDLDPGEKEAIALATQNPNSLLIMDEMAGRREALRRGLNLIGTVGILQEAKLRGFLAAIRPDLEKLRSNGFHLSDAVFRKILNSAGE